MRYDMRQLKLFNQVVLIISWSDRNGDRRRGPPGYPLAVFSGMLGVTLFGIFLTPVFFYTLLRRGRS